MRTADQHKRNNEKEYSYNLSELVALSNGSNEFVIEMIDIFVKSSAEILLQIKKAVENNDWEKVSSQAHKAIPSFHFMGLKMFSDELRFIETNALNPDEQAKIKEMMYFIDTQMNTVFEDLKQELPKFKI